MITLEPTALLMPPLPSSIAETTYSAVLRRLQCDSSQPADRQLESLLALDPETILTNVGPELPLLPVVDGDIITSNITFEQWSS
jgi:hypothetical protein